jgi:hypothetical protein
VGGGGEGGRGWGGGDFMFKGAQIRRFNSPARPFVVEDDAGIFCRLLALQTICKREDSKQWRVSYSEKSKRRQKKHFKNFLKKTICNIQRWDF